MLSDGEVAAFGPPDDVLRPEVVEAVYGVRAYLHRHAGRTYLTFSPRLRGERRGRVHLVCGGGTGAGMMRELVDAGYEVTAGVLNALDTDEETGSELGLRMAVEAPFSPVGDEAHAENLQLMGAADLVVVSAVPVSHGNARNIDAVREALAQGIPVWADDTVRANDFVGAVDGLAAAGAQFFAGEEALLAAVRGRSLGGVGSPAPGTPAERVAASPFGTTAAPQASIRAAGRLRRPARETGRADHVGRARPASLHHPGRPPSTRPGSRTAASPAAPSGQASVTASTLVAQSVRATASALTVRPGRVSPPGARPGPSPLRAASRPVVVPCGSPPDSPPARTCTTSHLGRSPGPDGSRKQTKGGEPYGSPPFARVHADRLGRLLRALLAEHLP